jgi:DNA-binding MarR family transcriptional regulator
MDKVLKQREKASACAPPHYAGPSTVDYGPLKQRLGYVLRRAQVAVFQDFFEAFSELDLRPAQYSVLTLIEHKPGLPQGRVAEALGIQKTNFVAMIGALKDRDLVRREPSKQDRRIHGLFLTRKGETLMVNLHKSAQEHEMRIQKRIGKSAYHELFSPLELVAFGKEPG